MKAALMICGGTFDSQQRIGVGLAVDGAFDPRRYEPLVAAVQKRFPGIQLSLISPPFRIDSSQLIPSHISDLIRAIKHVPDGFDGLVVAVGTDTLSYIVPGVATALGCILDRCIVFVSGMEPWDAENSSALRNLFDALHLIEKRHHRGVMMVSGGQVYPPYNIAKISPDAVDPFREVRLSQRETLERLPVVLQNLLGRGVSVGKPYGGSETVSLGPLVDCGSFKQGGSMESVVMQIRIFPGLRVDSILRFVGAEAKHVIFLCYANGTAPVSDSGSDFNIAEAVRQLCQRGVKCYAVSQHLGVVAPGDYEVCHEMAEAGCLYVARFTAETLHAILLALSAAIADPAEVQEHIRESEQQLA